MKPVRSVIIDDDVFIHAHLQEKLDLYKNEVEVIAAYTDPVAAIEGIRRLKPELLFLDVQMPVMNGFELLDQLGPESFQVIFITSFNKYAIQAIRYSALDYLLKPIDQEDLGNALARHRQHKSTTVNATRISNLKHNMLASSSDTFTIVVPTRTGEKQFAVNDIIRMEADSNYTWIYLQRAARFLASKTLKEFDDLLYERKFIRAHKSHLVNRNYIRSLTSDAHLLLTDDTRIEVSRRRLSEVRDALAT